jgi:DNA-binding response OmpR family regulator
LLNKGKTLSRTRLIQHVYDWSYDCDSNVIDAHMANLRKKLRQATGHQLVETVRGIGFLISEPAS